jgi:membrane-bound lytic murein transglycosylase D
MSRMHALPRRWLAVAVASLLASACATTAPVAHAPKPAPVEPTRAPDGVAPVVAGPEATAVTGPETPATDAAPVAASAVDGPTVPAAPAVAASAVPVEATGADVFARIRARLRAPVCSDSGSAHTWEGRYARHPTVFARKVESILPLLDFVAAETERSGLPAEFVFIPLVESWYEPGAMGRGGPAGMWQMIGTTARNHGIGMRAGYDGRLSPVESTRAALSYLRTLAGMFDGDWQATVMAYNAGEYRLAGALRRSGSRLVSAESRQPAGLSPITYDYVAKLQALSCLIAQPQRHGVQLPEQARFARLAPVLVDARATQLDRVAAKAGVPAEQLRALNPAYRSGHIPAGVPRLLLMPVAAGSMLAADAGDMLLAAAEPEPVIAEPAVSGAKNETHQVRNGDTLSQIARQYGVSLKALRRINRLGSGSRIRPGQVLRLVP